MADLTHAESVQCLETVSDWLRWCMTCLAKHDIYLGHGADSHWDEALQLVLTALSLPIDIDEVCFDAKVLPSERQKISDWIIARSEKRQPLPYITQRAWFMRMPYYVDERVLIPRSPFGEWLEKSFSPWLDADTVKSVCDVGTGSGCIAIASAHVFPNAKVDAIDISEDALAVATINVNKHGVKDRVRLLHGNALNVVCGDKQYDLIISNPPYVPYVEQASLPEEYLYEPKQALFADDDGFAIVDDIIQSAAQHLSEKGLLIVEVGQNAEAFALRYPTLSVTWLTCESGGEGLFMLTREALQVWQSQT